MTERTNRLRIEKGTEAAILPLSETAWQFIKIAVTTIIPLLALKITYTVNTLFVELEHDAEQLAGYGLGYVFSHTVLVGIFLGMNGAFETLCAQAYGAGQLKMCGAYLNLAYVITSIAFVIGGTILWLVIPCFVHLGQDKEVIENAQEFVKYHLIGCYFFALYDLNRRYLICFKVTTVPMVLIVAISALHVLICYLLVDFWGSAMIGLGVASTITCLELLVATWICVFLQQETQFALVMPDIDIMNGWKEYLTIAIPLAAIFLFECMAWSGMSIIAGYLSVEEQAALVVTMQTDTLFAEIGIGIQGAVSIMVSHSIGANNVGQAKQTLHAAIICSYSLSTIILTTLFCFKTQVAEAQLTDQEQIDQVVQVQISILLTKTIKTQIVVFRSSVLELFCIYNFIYMTLMITVGSTRPLGLQNRVTIASIFCLYAVGLPLSIYFAFDGGMQIFGIWLGYAIGLLSLASITSYMVYNRDMQLVAEQAQVRIHGERQILEALMQARSVHNNSFSADSSRNTQHEEDGGIDTEQTPFISQQFRQKEQ